MSIGWSQKERLLQLSPRLQDLPEEKPESQKQYQAKQTLGREQRVKGSESKLSLYRSYNVSK